MGYSQDDLGKVLSLKAVTTSTTKVGVGLGVQNTMEVYIEIVFGPVNAFPIEKRTDWNCKQVFMPINPLGNFETRIADKPLEAILLFVFFRFGLFLIVWSF